jgi:hypothetical protein
MNTAIDNARSERQQQLQYLNQYIENSPMTQAQKENAKALAKYKSEQLYDTDVQYANSVKQALATNDISMFDDTMQYQIIQGQVNDILNSP